MANKLKVEKLKSVFNCKYCSKILNNPIALDCGLTICEIHTAEIVQNKCLGCNEIHTVPSGGFRVNQAMKEMLDLRVNSIELSPKFESCNEIIQKVKSTVSKIDQIEKDPENYIYEYFEAIKQKVDLRRENLKQEIDDYSNRIIEDINKIKSECIEISKKAKKISIDIKKLKDELNELYEDFDSFVIDDQKYENIFAKIEVLKPKFEASLDTYKSTLLKDGDYTFEHKQFSIEDIFGQFFVSEKFSESNILNKQNQIDLTNICEFSKEQKWKLVYRASCDGFEAGAFHLKCDGTKNTLTIVKTTNGYIFGGYADQHWRSSAGEWINDPNAFLFSLINKDDFAFKANCIEPQHAIISNTSYGPTFGHDLHIRSDSHINQTSVSNFPYSYTHANYPNKTHILAGSYNFQTVEVEVFCKET